MVPCGGAIATLLPPAGALPVLVPLGVLLDAALRFSLTAVCKPPSGGFLLHCRLGLRHLAIILPAG